LTSVRMQPRPAATTPAALTDTLYASGPQVRDDMTVEVALSVMTGARTGHLLICDEDDQCTGLVTEARLTAVRDHPSYTDQVRLRDVIGAGGPFAPPVAGMPGTGCAARYRQPSVLCVGHERDGALGVVTLAS
jgi:hypothetical protein